MQLLKTACSVFAKNQAGQIDAQWSWKNGAEIRSLCLNPDVSYLIFLPDSGTYT